jgi:hypothetical protein
VSLGDSPTQVLPSVLKTEEIYLNQTLVMLMSNRKIEKGGRFLRVVWLFFWNESL